MSNAKTDLKEGKDNKEEAKKSREKRMKDAEAKTPEPSKNDMNAQNRRISALLRQNRQERDISTLSAQMRKLKNENAALKQQLAQLAAAQKA